MASFASCFQNKFGLVFPPKDRRHVYWYKFQYYCTTIRIHTTGLSAPRSTDEVLECREALHCTARGRVLWSCRLPRTGYQADAISSRRASQSRTICPSGPSPQTPPDLPGKRSEISIVARRPCPSTTDGRLVYLPGIFGAPSRQGQELSHFFVRWLFIEVFLVWPGILAAVSR
ncbi:hypothetical protein VTK26DRAFT_4246 [Humicola hyalothermophila]